MTCSNCSLAENVQPLHAAVWRRDVAAVERLLSNGANVIDIDEAGQSPLHYACWSVHQDRGFHRNPARATRIVELLLEAGAPVDVRDALGFLPSARCEGVMPPALREAVVQAAARGSFWVPEDSREDSQTKRGNVNNSNGTGGWGRACYD